MSPCDYVEWTVDQPKQILFHLIEFVVNFKCTKSESKIKPGAMKDYITGIQRSFSRDWGYRVKLLEGHIFNCVRDGLMALINNKFSFQQCKGVFSESHNDLSSDDFKRLYNSPLLTRDNPLGFPASLILDIALITAMQSTALVNLTANQFTEMKLCREDISKIKAAVRRIIGASKTNSGGWNTVREKVTEICVWNRPSLDGNLNIFEYIGAFMLVRMAMDCGTDRFFLGANQKATKFGDFFRRQHL